MHTEWTYRDDVLRTANAGQSEKDQLTNCAMGMAGEAGEFCDMIKKHIFHGHALDRDKVINELGDIRFYLEWAAHLIDVPMAEIEKRNVDKLRRRYPTGFSSEASINRQD